MCCVWMFFVELFSIHSYCVYLFFFNALSLSLSVLSLSLSSSSSSNFFIFPNLFYFSSFPTLLSGCPHLQHHIRTITEKFGVRVVVAVNKMTADSDAELAMVCKAAKEAGASDAVVSSHWENGGRGAVALANATMAACAAASKNPDDDTFKYLYDINASIKDKLFSVCSEVYNAAEVTYSDEANEAIAAYEKLGLTNYPVCIAKTQYSLSTDKKAVGVPTGHTVNVREVKASMGAGMIVAICGDIMTIPGLPTRPGFVDVDYDFNTKRIVGLF